MNTLFLDHNDQKFWNYHFSQRGGKVLWSQFRSSPVIPWKPNQKSDKIRPRSRQRRPPVGQHLESRSDHQKTGNLMEAGLGSQTRGGTGSSNTFVHDLFTLRSRLFTLFHALLRYFCGGRGDDVPLAPANSVEKSAFQPPVLDAWIANLDLLFICVR